MVNIPKIAEAAGHVFNISGLFLYLYIFRLEVLLGFYVELKVLRWASYENKMHQLEMFDTLADYPPGIGNDDWIPFWTRIRERTYAELAYSFEEEYFLPNLLFNKAQQQILRRQDVTNSLSVLDITDKLQ